MCQSTVIVVKDSGGFWVTVYIPYSKAHWTCRCKSLTVRGFRWCRWSGYAGKLSEYPLRFSNSPRRQSLFNISSGRLICANSDMCVRVKILLVSSIGWVMSAALLSTRMQCSGLNTGCSIVRSHTRLVVNMKLLLSDELTSARSSLGVRSTREKGFSCSSLTLRPCLHVR